MTIYITGKELTNRTLGKLKKDARVVIGDVLESELANICSREIPADEIWLYHPLVECDGAVLSMEQLLLDERLAEGLVNIPKAALEQCGYLNEKLQAKRRYELLVRLAEQYVVKGFYLDGHSVTETMLSSESGSTEKTQMTGTCDEKETFCQEYMTDCYMAGKYSAKLQELGYFEAIVQELIERAAGCGDSKLQADMLAWLETMIARGDAFYKISDATAPILAYYGVTFCYNIMNVLMDGFVHALQSLGERVIVYDEQAEDIAGLSRFMGQRFKAVLGVQSYLMSVFMKESNCFLHDQIIGPKFNMILDHPVWMKKQLEQVPANYYVLTHDENYKKFIETYYPGVSGTYLLPPGGMTLKDVQERNYDLTFIGTYGDYRKKCEVIYKSHKTIRYIANRFLLNMRKHTELTAEEALEKTLAFYGMELGKETFFDLLHEMRSVIQCVMYYYREKVVETLLKAEIPLHIWGDSWENSPLSNHLYLTIHKEILPDESLKIMQQSKLCLNVMAWHKGGFTERMANTMLSGAVLLTDKTTAYADELKDGENCLMFSLEELRGLPDRVKQLLEDDVKREQIAKNAYHYAYETHTWEQRAEQLLALLS